MEEIIKSNVLKRGSFFRYNVFSCETNKVREGITKNNRYGLSSRSSGMNIDMRARRPKRDERKERMTPEQLVEKSMPRDYSPPKARERIEVAQYKGHIKFYNDLGDVAPPVPSFSGISRNIAMKETNERTLLEVCCKCVDECISRECECKKLTSDNVELMKDGRIIVKEWNGKGKGEKGESGYLNHHLYTCGDKCSCSRSCANRISWEEREGEFEIIRRNSRMGYEVRSLRTFRQGEVVLEFIGEFEKNLEDKKALDYSFLVFDRREPNNSEGNLGIQGWIDELTIHLNPFIQGSIARFVCHSRMMNLIPLRVYSAGSFIGQPRLFFISCLTIAPGDFLKVDYGQYYHKCIIQPYDNSRKRKTCACDEFLCHNSKVLEMIGRRNRVSDFAMEILNSREMANRKRIWTMEMKCFRSIANNESNYTKSLLRNVRNLDEQEKIKKNIQNLMKYYREHEDDLRKEMAKDEAAEEWQRKIREEDEREEECEKEKRREKTRKRNEKIEKEEREGIENDEEWRHESMKIRRKLNNNLFDDKEKKMLKRRLKARENILMNEEEKRRNTNVECFTID